MVAVMLIVGGLGWKGKYFEKLFQRERIEKIQTEDESELKTDLIESVDQYHGDVNRRRTVRDQVIREVVDAGVESDGEADSLADRVRRSDAAWRSGIERMCPRCAAPSGDRDPDEQQSEGM